MKKSLLAGLACGVMMFLMAGLANADVIDQSNLAPASRWGAVISVFTWQQEVTAGMTGQLTGIEVFLTDYDGVANPENITTDVYLSGILIGSDTRLYNDVGSSSLTFDFSSDNIFMSSGQAFEFWAHGSDSFWNFAFDLAEGGYSGGTLRNTLGEVYLNHDFRFNTIVGSAAPVPEPSTFLLLGAGLAGLAGWRLRRRVR